MSQRSYRWLLWGLALCGAALDQSSKYGVFKWLYDDGERERVVIPGALKLLAQFKEKSATGEGILVGLRTWSGAKLPQVNPGALFGWRLGLNAEEHARKVNSFFAGVSMVAAIAIIYWSTRRSTARDRSLCAALGLIMAGTLGNLYDRIVFDGVRDFLYFHLIDWPVFNIADCCLVCGAFLLLGQAFLNRPRVSRQTVSKPSRVPEMAEVK